jgi:hypothetical protein
MSERYANDNDPKSNAEMSYLGQQDDDDGDHHPPAESPALERSNNGPALERSNNGPPPPAYEENSNSAQVRALKHFEKKRDMEDQKLLLTAQAQSEKMAFQDWRRQRDRTPWNIEWNTRALTEAVDTAYKRGRYSGIWMHVPTSCKLTTKMIEEFRHHIAMIRHQWSLDNSNILFLSVFEMTGDSMWGESLKHYKHVHIYSHQSKINTK